MIKYSVLIPSRNGGKYLYYAVKSILDNNYKNCEVIVSLNKTTDKSDIKIRQIKDQRLKIIKTPKYFSMVRHYEWIIKKAKGEWITIVGDDDGVVKNFFVKIDKILKSVKKHDIQAISSSRAFYFWKGVEHIYGPTVVRYLDTGKIKIKSSKIELLKTLFGFSPYQNLPLLYTSGIVKRNLINEIIKKSKKKFFNEPNPDIYSALAVTSLTKKFLRVEKPLFWVGTSNKSNAVNLINDLDKKKLHIDNNNFINDSKKDGYFLSQRIDPYFWQLRLRSGFLFSAFYRLPKKINKLYGNTFIDYMLLIFLVCDSKNRRLPFTVEEKSFLEKRIKNYIYKKKKNFLIITVLSVFYLLTLKIFDLIKKQNLKVTNFVYKNFFKKKFLYSKNRKKYWNILVANKHI